MRVQHFFDEPTGSLSYVVHDATAGVVIDPLRDYDGKSGRISWAFCERIAEYIRRERIAIPFAIETHAHADHMSGLPFFRERFGACTATGAGIGEVQRAFRTIYNLPDDFPVDGRQFGRLLEDGELLHVGSFALEVIHTPGHTPAHIALRCGDAVFVGDTLFMPDYGSARCDFPGGDAGTLYDSIQRLFALPPESRAFTGHDYKPGGRELAFVSTIEQQRRNNIQINSHTKRDEYVAFRTARDAQLETPLLLLPAVQVNIRAGELPEPEANGVVYLRIPLDVIGRS